jgi:hypothetical protein
MRKLRLEVDDLLAKGKVDEAEALMDARRRFFNDHGIPIRRINQAYFAFYGTYAASAASSNPIGPKVDQVWERTKDVGRFLAVSARFVPPPTSMRHGRPLNRRSPSPRPPRRAGCERHRQRAPRPHRAQWPSRRELGAMPL